MSGSFTALAPLAGLSLAIWIYLFFFRDGFWRADQFLEAEGARAGRAWPRVIALVPARNEADVIAQSLKSLLAQDYPGPFSVILVDDHSSDATTACAKEAAEALDAAEHLSLIEAGDLPVGWSGKLWALNEGLAMAVQAAPPADYLWLSDADITHRPATLTRLVAKAEGEARDLVSIMPRLKCEGLWGRLLIPPFIYFFQKLYPFRAVADPKRRVAAAAGGCVLLRRDALQSAGGFAAIRDALIDDCSLAALIKHRKGARAGGIWLGHTQDSVSIRPYKGLTEIWNMVARSAYTQLRHSPWLLLGTLIGMTLTYLVPPLALLTALVLGDLPSGILALAAWGLMTASSLPTLRLYGQPDWQALSLPLAALLYSAMTLSSAGRHWRGQGGRWKGRLQAPLDQDASPR
jgi:hopene-associated glycosyltransferase HpnB